MATSIHVVGSFNNSTRKKVGFLGTLSELQDINDIIEDLYCSNIIFERIELFRLRGFLTKKSDFLINPVVGKKKQICCAN